MNSFHRPVWQCGVALVLSFTLVGCGSSKAKNAAKAAPAANAVAAAPPGMAPVPGMAPAPGTAVPPGTTPQATATTAAAIPPGAPGAATTPMPMPATTSPTAPGTATPAASNIPGMLPPPGASPTTPNTSQNATTAAAATNLPGSTSPGAIPNNPTAAGTTGTTGQSNPAMMGLGGRGGNARQPREIIKQTAAGDKPSGVSPGSADEAVYYFCLAMSDGDTLSAAEYVSPKAKGVLGELRDGTLSEDKIEEIVTLVSPAGELQKNQTDESSGTKRSLINRKEQIMSFTLRKEKEGYRLMEFSHPRSKKK